MSTLVIEERKPQTEAEYIADRQLEVAKIKFQANTIAIGIVTGIFPVKSKFGASFKVIMDHTTYFYNSNVKDEALALEMVKKMLPVGKRAAFQYKTKINGQYHNKTIESIFYTFND